MKERKPGKARRITGDILLLLVIVFTVYLSAVMLYRIRTVVLSETYKMVFRRELVLCAVMLLFALDVRFAIFTRFAPLRPVGWIVRIAVAAATVLLLVLTGRVIAVGMVNNAGGAEHVIVLGMALEKGKPNRDLLLRVETAGAYAKENPDALLILTGGNPDESGRTEAAVMRDLLLEYGVPEERLVLEDKAADTRSNFRNTAKLMDPGDPVVVVSSNYHMGRAVKTARQAGFSQVRRLPASSEPLFYGANVFWEVLMELNSLTKGR